MLSESCKEKYDLSDGPARSLYVHVPFCRAKCRYCDFYSLPREEGLAGRYVRAVQAELALRRGELAVPLETIFVGGGTPTSLDLPLLRELLSTLQSAIDHRQSAIGVEFSVEANPGTLTEKGTALLRECGVTRVNLGVQSLWDAELAVLGRIHSAAEAIEAVALLRQAGFERPGLDLIYGIPGQTLGSWQDSLTAALDLRPGHLSCYALSFEPETPLLHDLQAARVKPMDDGLQRECYCLAIDLAASAGLEHYEISNFAAPSMRCRHNIVYWRNQPYLGLGPAAVSYVGGVRRKNEPDLGKYLQALESGCLPPTECERVTGRMAMAETMMLGLRMIEGVDRSAFARRFGRDPVTAFPASLERHRRIGSLLVNDQAIRIARPYLFVSDTILADLIAEGAEAP